MFIFSSEKYILRYFSSDSVAQSDACLTGDQEAADLLPARSSDILWRHEIFSTHYLPLIQEGPSYNFPIKSHTVFDLITAHTPVAHSQAIP